jgi:hypothetical protein
MTIKLTNVTFLLVFVISYVCVSTLALDSPPRQKNPTGIPVKDFPKAGLAGADIITGDPKASDRTAIDLGYDEVRSGSPGMQIGTTTYDKQSNGRMNRQVDWRGTQVVHFIWVKMTIPSLTNTDRVTAYELWDIEDGSVYFGPGGCSIHPDIQASGYVSLDVDTEGKAVIANHHSDYYGGLPKAVTLWYDILPAACFFSPYKYRLPDINMEYGSMKSGRFLWPSMEYQVYGGDTVTHVFAKEDDSLSTIEYSPIHYFRRVGSDTLGSWDYPPVIVDTNTVVSQTVTASRVSGKVALVWLANLPAIPGGSESVNRGSDVDNDVYYMVSSNMGADWGPKVNVTASDSSKSGWRAHTDLSCLITSDDYLHIIWDAREYSPIRGGMFPHPFGSRLFHWDESGNTISVIKDANWDLPYEDFCHGGQYNQMSIVKMQISECDGKLYALFVQFNDIYNGIDDDCAAEAFGGSRYAAYFTGRGGDGTANGELYISISDDGGITWDMARNLTNSYTPYCDTSVTECDSDMWPSMSRFGMQVDPASNFDSAVVVDPTGSYTGDYYLDVLYVNDKYPGSFGYNGECVWTVNPVKWFRLPCIEPEVSPYFASVPKMIGAPAWVAPGHQLDTVIRLENVGNAGLSLDITIEEITTPPSGWLDVDETMLYIPAGAGNYYDLQVYLNAGGVVIVGPRLMEGRLIIDSDSPSSPDTIPVSIIVADTLQSPVTLEIRTACKRLNFDNTGRLGNSGIGGRNLDFFEDCDTTANVSPEDGNAGHFEFYPRNDNARVYLYEASPLVARIKGSDTILNYSMYSADWLSNNGFRPLRGPSVDSTSSDDFRYGSSGKFVTRDSSIAILCDFYAPKPGDTCDFIVIHQIFSNNTGDSLKDVLIGDFVDFDIPSDTGVENGSGFDVDRQMMYCHGAEYGTDQISNNDCVLADSRYGGFSYYGGRKISDGSPSDTVTFVQGMYTHMNADWVYPNNGFVPGEIYRKIEGFYGYEPWESTNPSMEDSSYQDLHIVSITGKFDFAPAESYEFVKVLATEYSGGLTALQGTIDMAYDRITEYLFGAETNVTNLDDSGPGSLREAITLANSQPGADTITFDTSGTIQLTSALPSLTGSGTVILGSSAPVGAHSVVIDGSGRFTGSGLTIESSNNRVEGLTIRNFSDNGIEVKGISSTANTISNNLIYNNGLLGIDLGDDGVTVNDPGDVDTGPNTLLNCPEIDSVKYHALDSSFTVYGRTSMMGSTVEFFVAHSAKDDARPADGSGHGEAYTYIGYTTSDSLLSFDYTITNEVSHFSEVTCTATDIFGNTSEFSENFVLIPGPLIIVAYSPVNMWVTDPDGDYIGKDSSGNLDQTIPGASYDEPDHDSVTIPEPEEGEYTIDIVKEEGADPGASYSVGIRINGSVQEVVVNLAKVPDYGTSDTYTYGVEEYGHYANGDADGDGILNMLDILFSIGYLYKGGPAPNPVESADADCDGTVNMLDILYLIAYLYKGGPEPCEIPD